MADTPQHPFQCLAVTKRAGADQPYLLAACGSRLLSTSLGKSPTVSEWSAPPLPASAITAREVERPAKKQKTAATAPAASNIIKLTVSPSDQHAVIVTEDKIVRVLEIAGDGTFVELSQRAMPKRPCAVTILPDNATILCGDKFGDVYSLPLLPEERPDDTDAKLGAEEDRHEKAAQTFKPSASNTTVHTKRNRKALEAQLKQQNLTAKTKEPLKFEHKLLLGHVSMLTDLAFANREVDGKQRGYILTADRDEHIRVSRGPPQSHVIEGYCLGHTEYVSKICPIPGTDVLISGGGDSWIGVWEWPSYKLVKKLDILDVLKDFELQRPMGTLDDSLAEITEDLSTSKPPGVKIEKVDVSGIWVVPSQVGDVMKVDRPIAEGKPTTEPCLVVSCESIAAMLVCPVADLLGDAAKMQPMFGFDGPILDVTSVGEVGIITVDDRAPGGSHRISGFRLEREKTGRVEFYDNHKFDASLEKVNGLTAEVKNEKSLDGLLYGVANLRKRGYQAGDGGADGEEGAVAEENGVGPE